MDKQMSASVWLLFLASLIACGGAPMSGVPLPGTGGPEAATSSPPVWHARSVTPGSGGDLELDAARVHHLVTFIPRAGGKTLRYAQCSSDCTDSANWQTVDVKDVGLEVLGPDLEVDSTGRARVSWTEVSSSSGATAWFAQCDLDCLSMERWQSLPLKDVSQMASGKRHLALGRRGEAHVVVADTSVSSPGTHVLSCAGGGCAQPDRWTSARLGHFALDHASLLMDVRGVQHVAGVLFREDRLQYGRCSRGCDAAGGWSWVDLGPATQAPALALDASGRVLIALARPKDVGVWSCTQGCSTRDGWRFQPVLDAERPSDVQLSLGLADEPTVAFSDRDKSRVRVVSCAYGCLGTDASWLHADVAVDPQPGAAGLVRSVTARALANGVDGRPRLLFEKSWKAVGGEQGAAGLWLAAGE